MLELKALLLTQGMHGMISQAEGLAKALKLNYILWQDFFLCALK